MSNQFQNRLVGTVVLVSLGVIFLPDLLDGKVTRQEDQFVEIPLRPEVIASTMIEEEQRERFTAPPAQWVEAVATVEAPTPPKRVEQASQVLPSPKTPKTSVVAPSAPHVAGFTLQLGSFNHVDNVNALVAQLRKNGFRAYTVPATPKAGVLTKVFVGPDLSEAKLKQVQLEVEHLTRLQGRVVPFSPN